MPGARAICAATAAIPRFAVAGRGTAADFFALLRAAFDMLWMEGQDRPAS